MGNVRNWFDLRRILSHLPQAFVAKDDEVLDFVARHKLHGIAVGYVDAHLLASAQLTDDTQLWSRDRRLAQAARNLGLISQSLPSLQ